MKFDLIFIGGGVGSSYGAINLIKKLNQVNNKQQINIAIIDKKYKNIPGVSRTVKIYQVMDF